MCNGFWWIIILWLLLGNNGFSNGCGCAQETNSCGCDNWGSQRNTRSCGCAQERENDCDCGCDNVRVVRGCCN